MVMMNPGKYSGRLIEVKSGASANDNPQISFIWEIFYVQQGNDWVELEQPIRRTSTIYFSEKSMDFSFDKLKSMEFRGLPSNPKVEDFSEQVRTSLILVCEHEKKQKGEGMAEKWSPEIWFGNLGGEPARDLKREEADAMDARWKNYMSTQKR
ncbi:MAG TPA: hypothetical protein PLP42_12855 [Acidobacteriota bacterium]|nr:hypothetical protein [Acidobacteriota bacterium]